MTLEERNKYIILFDKYQNFLTNKQRQIFEMYLFEDLTYAEIGQALKTSRNNAHDTIKKSISKLEQIKTNLSKEINENN